MDINRIGRYKDKLNLISERAQDIEEWVRGYDSSDFIDDKKTRFAVYNPPSPDSYQIVIFFKSK